MFLGEIVSTAEHRPPSLEGRSGYFGRRDSAIDDWSDEGARNGLLTEMVRDARRMLALAEGAGGEIARSAEPLCALLLQDIVAGHRGERIAWRTGGKDHSKDQGGHGPRSHPFGLGPGAAPRQEERRQAFTGHKASVATDLPASVNLAVGNAHRRGRHLAA